MPCLLVLLATIAPRLVIVLLFLFSEVLKNAYETTIWPLLGFFFMPYTTLAYAWAMHSRGAVSGIFLVIVVVAVLLDLGIIGAGARQKKHADEDA